MSTYKVEVTYQVRHLLEVGTDSPESAEKFADELVLENTNWGDMHMDTYISAYTSKVKEGAHA